MNCKHGQLARSCNVCELEQERCDLQDLAARQAALLTAAADALRGPPPELKAWSHHDIAERIDALRAERDEAIATCMRFGQELGQFRADYESLRAERDALAAKLAEPNRDPINADALHEIRVACREIMGGNLAFVDDDFARCLLTLKAECDALRAERDEATAILAEVKADLDVRAVKGVVNLSASRWNRMCDWLASHRPEQKG